MIEPRRIADNLVLGADLGEAALLVSMMAGPVDISRDDRHLMWSLERCGCAANRQVTPLGVRVGMLLERMDVVRVRDDQ
ncbi:MAG: hypothetical protein EON93_01675 [Burkholderiales bacterium]|nr:MAG: hypothetical protein EON93_01675 [Burkholderiales bacterium]